MAVAIRSREIGVITLTGPERAAGVLTAMARMLEARGMVVETAIGVSDLATAPGIDRTEFLVTILTPCGAPEMDAMPRLRGIVSPLLGYEWIDLEEATRRAIPVVNGEAAENRESMAEATILLVLALLYQLHAAEAALRRPGTVAAPRPRMLKGRTVGIIGYGGISREIIKRLEAWGCVLQVATRTPPTHPGAIRFVALDDLLATSDVIIVMTSLDSGSRHMLDRTRLRQVRRGALLVNTARGGLIDEDALIDALETGLIAAAALDVFEVEPLAADHRLRSLPNVILTGHGVGHTRETHEAIPGLAVANLLALVEGRLPASCKNPAVASAWSAG